MENTEVLKALAKLQGKKLLWSGSDLETEAIVLIFEGDVAFAVTNNNIEQVENLKEWAAATLDSSSDYARSIIALEGLFAEKS